MDLPERICRDLSLHCTPKQTSINAGKIPIPADPAAPVGMGRAAASKSLSEAGDVGRNRSKKQIKPKNNLGNCPSGVNIGRREGEMWHFKGCFGAWMIRDSAGGGGT